MRRAMARLLPTALLVAALLFSRLESALLAPLALTTPITSVSVNILFSL